MLYVLCRVGRDTYAVSSEIVVRILPFVALKALPGAPSGVAGLLNYQGASVPVVDLALVLTGHPAREVLSTRILLCSCSESASRLIGVVLEGVSNARRIEEREFRPTGAAGAECLSEVSGLNESLIQRIEIPRIFPPGVIASLGLGATYSAA